MPSPASQRPPSMRDRVARGLMECEHPLMHTTVFCTGLFALYLLLCCWLRPTSRLVVHEPVTGAAVEPIELWPAQLFSKNIFVAFARYRSFQGYGRALKPEAGPPKAQPPLEAAPPKAPGNGAPATAAPPPTPPTDRQPAPATGSPPTPAADPAPHRGPKRPGRPVVPQAAPAVNATG
eukprot:EG_transcript_24865